MKVYSLDGTEYIWIPSNSPKGIVSANHLRAREFLKKRFPTLQILEESPITITAGTTLFLDFYIPLLKTAIEVHGEQHYEYNNFHYKNEVEFKKAQERDLLKQQWLKLNNIRYIELLANENINEWESRFT